MPTPKRKRTKRTASRTRREAPQELPESCEYHPACVRKPTEQLQDGRWVCLYHEVFDRKSREAKRRYKRNPLAGAAVEILGAVANNVIAQPQGLQIAAGVTAQRAQNWYQERQQQRAAPPKTNPFQVLGLDRNKATAADVKKMQRKLAALYHGDTAEGSVAADKMAEINAAADEALKILGG